MCYNRLAVGLCEFCGDAAVAVCTEVRVLQRCSVGIVSLPLLKGKEVI